MESSAVLEAVRRGLMTPEEARGHLSDTPQPEKPSGGLGYAMVHATDPIKNAILGFGAGMSKFGAGAIQGADYLTGNNLLDNQDRDILHNLVSQANKDIPTFGKTGQVAAFGGSTLPYFALPASAATPMGAAGLGAVSGGVSGFLSPEGQGENINRPESAVIGGTMGAGLGYGGAKVAEALLPSVAAARPTSRQLIGNVQDTLQGNAQEARKAAQDQFTFASKSGLKINGQVLGQEVTGKYLKNLSDANFSVAQGVYPKLEKTLKSVQKDMQGTMGIPQIQGVRSKLTTFINDNYDAAKGGYNAEAKAAIHMRSALDDTLDEAAQNNIIQKGDAMGLKAFQNGLKQWKDYRQTFTNSSAVRKLVTGEGVSDAEAFSNVFGGQSLTAKGASKNFDEVMKAAGPQVPMVKDMLRKGVIQNLRESAGELNGQQLDVNKLRSYWNQFTQKNGEIRSSLFSKAEINQINKAIFNGKPEKIGKALGVIGGGLTGAGVGIAVGGPVGAAVGGSVGSGVGNALPNMGLGIARHGAEKALDAVSGLGGPEATSYGQRASDGAKKVIIKLSEPQRGNE